MAVIKVSDFLKNPTAKLAEGDTLFAHVRSEGYLPSIGDTNSLAQGQLVFRVKTVGGKKSILPAYIDHQAQALKFKDKEPVVYVDGTSIVYHVGQNYPVYRDGYHGTGFNKYENVKPADVDKQMVLAFLDFADSTLSLGVNDFRIEETTFEAAPVTP
ncbi:hypothetical protein BPS13_0173 [Bacillus phage BPS13]|uniref:Uncharacterized protein n=3 Tax=Wphvirus TaxID=1922327 RepID=W5QUK2_9CAUD|nr:Ig domain containing protein [Bacillus phage BPS13]YP_009003057.1 Ig domain containing protein [Bacillus phage BPS10C]YP_009282134.1 Ig domain containing protein [Bacillus phage SalinJah]AEZ50352.1 hypothetical protein BPS13_0173 [Bacillus phage BPS13]AGI12168.1 hypothetical protein BPS10C_171 [Bacillus phage BPS10C]ANH50631.1 hypothetical protein SALINJAH_180 [Bacillus phage SalinJah]